MSNINPINANLPPPVPVAAPVASGSVSVTPAITPAFIPPSPSASYVRPELPRPSKNGTASASPVVPERTRSDKVNREELKAALANANVRFESEGYEVRFQYELKINTLIVRLIDSSTQEVLRQYPTEDDLRALQLTANGGPLIESQA